MKHIKPEEIDILTEKLAKEGDISPKEADRIFSLFSERNRTTRLYAFSGKRDLELISAVSRWFRQVKKALEEGKTGMFVSTIHMQEHRELISMLELIDTVSFLRVSDALKKTSEKAKIADRWQETASKTEMCEYGNGMTEILRAGFLRRYEALPDGLRTGIKDLRDITKKIKKLPDLFEATDRLFDALLYLSLDCAEIPYMAVRYGKTLFSFDEDEILFPEDTFDAVEIIKEKYWPGILEKLINSRHVREFDKALGVFPTVSQAAPKLFANAYRAALRDIKREERACEDIWITER